MDDSKSEVTPDLERAQGTLYNAYSATNGLCFVHIDLNALVSLWSHRIVTDYSARGDKIWSYKQ